MDTKAKWEALKALDVDSLECYSINQLYERAIPKQIERITGVYPCGDFRPNSYETFEQNAARFRAEILDPNFGGDGYSYRLARMIGQFKTEGTKLYFYATYSDLDNLLFLLHHVATGTLPDKYLTAITDDIRNNTGRPFLADSWPWRRTVKIGGVDFDVKAYKNGWYEVKNLTPAQAAEIERVRVICEKRT